MFKSVNAKSIAAIAAAAVVASLAVFLTPAAQGTDAEAQVTVPLHGSSVKGDRRPRDLKGAACSSRGWPHHEQGCQFDRRRPADEAQTIRVALR